MKLILEIETKDQSSVNEALVLLTTLLNVKVEVTTSPEGTTPTKKPLKRATKPKETKPEAEPTPEPKKPSEAPKKQEGVSLGDVKTRASEKAKVDREAVKKVISNYAPKLSEVSPEDYGKLYKALGEL